MVLWGITVSIFLGVLFFKERVVVWLVSRLTKLQRRIQNWHLNCTQWLRNLLRTKANRLDENLNKGNFMQDSLSPKLLTGDELEKINPYIKRINDGIRNPEISNIALMGNYGSGKSTIIRNFEVTHPEYKILNLSLGSYSKKEVPKEGTTENDSLEELNEQLENSLVKQMIYREKNSKLPYSRFKKIRNISKSKMFFSFLSVATAMLCIFYLQNFLGLKNLIKKSQLLTISSNQVSLIVYGVLIFSGFLILYKIFKILLQQFKLSKLNVANISIEGNDNSLSYFNKYIDEILYYFEINRFDIVVIEDVDRFKSINVFEHLKELNVLLNNSQQINRNITFIYAVKEDIFSQSKEAIEEPESEIRTKFFELIIPVLPVVDAFNSRDYLIPMMESKYKGLGQDFNKDFKNFLKDISLYIQDLRLLTNIINEYFTYLEIHKSVSNSMNPQALFSIISLKNLVPAAYTDLQKSQGLVYELIDKKKYTSELIAETKSELEEINEDLKKLERQINIDKVTEIKKIFFNHGVSNIDEIYLDGNQETLDSLDVDMIDKILDSNEPLVVRSSPYISNVNIDKSDLTEALIEKSQVLKTRKERIKKEYDLQKDKIDKIDRLSLEEKLKEYPQLVGMIAESDDNSFKNDNDFILYILSNGYLAEDYSTYLSVFYEKNISIDDKNVLIKLKSHQFIEFSAGITDPQEVINELSVPDFKNQGILNINLLTYLFSREYKDENNVRESIIEKLFDENEEEYLKKLDVILDTDKSQTVNIILELVKKYKDAFIRKCEDVNIDRLVDRIIYSCLSDDSSYYNKDAREKILFDSLKSFESEDDPNFLISQNISSRPSFFTEISEYVNVDKLMEFLWKFNSDEHTYDDAKISFPDLNMERLSSEVFENFIRYEFFEYNPNLFSKILSYNNDSESEIISYKQVLAYENKDLIESVDGKLAVFVRDVLLKQDTLDESEESFLKIINSDQIELFETEFISKSNYILTDLTKVNDLSIWGTLLEKGKCEITWENMQIFYRDGESDLGILKEIFNSEKNVLELMDQYKSSESKVELEMFLMDLVDSKTIEVNVDNLELLKIAKYNATELDKESMQLLAENDLVIWNLENVEVYEENSILTEMLLSYPIECLENYNEINLSKNDVIQLIKKWNKETIDRLLEITVNRETDTFFENTELIGILKERKIEASDDLFERLLENNESDQLSDYFMYNLKNGNLSKELIEKSLNTFYENNQDKFDITEYDNIFESISDVQLSVNLINHIFINEKLKANSIELVEGWLGTQNEPLSKLYIGQRAKVILKNTPENNELLNNLMRIGIVSTKHKINEDDIVVNNRRKHSKTDKVI